MKFPANNVKLLAERFSALFLFDGKVKGAALKIDAEYVKKIQGNESLQLIEEKFKEFGQPFSFSDIEPMNWYPEAISVGLVLLAKNLFKWDDNNLYEMGGFAPKISLIAQVSFVLTSPESVFKNVNEYWKKYYDFGEIESVSYSRENRRMIFRMKGYPFGDTMNPYFRGYFAKMCAFAVKTKHVSVYSYPCSAEEAKKTCTEFRLSWQ